MLNLECCKLLWLLHVQVVACCTLTCEQPPALWRRRSAAIESRGRAYVRACVCACTHRCLCRTASRSRHALPREARMPRRPERHPLRHGIPRGTVSLRRGARTAIVLRTAEVCSMQVCPEPPRSPTDMEACHIHDDIVDDWELTRTRYVGSYGKFIKPANKHTRTVATRMRDLTSTSSSVRCATVARFRLPRKPR